MRNTRRGLRDGARCGHAVQIYGDEHELVGSVAAYLAAGFEAGEPGAVLVTPEHRRALDDALARLGWDTTALVDAGALTVADAEGTLASFLESTGPSPARFHTAIGRLLGAVEARHPGRRLRVFGEMVDLLSRRGRHEAALALEELWDDLAKRRGFSLLCGYGLDLFDPAAQRAVLPGVCRAHDEVVPAADLPRLEHAVERALEEALGPDEAGRIRLLAGEARRDEHIPAAQLALMWVSARMPALAGRVLGLARAGYESPAAAPGR